VRLLHHFLNTRTEPWGFIKSLVQTYTIHMKLSLRLSFYLGRSLESYTRAPPQDSLSKPCPTISPPNLAKVPGVSYVYLFSP
jgi:hypothetical protein